MKNTVYHRFIELYAEGKIDVLKKDAYRLALVTSAYEADEDTNYGFYEGIQNLGYEVVDQNGSYERGGKDIEFVRISGSDSDGVVQYTVGKIQWTDVSIEDACQAVVYRKSDGLLIACYRFSYPMNIKGQTLQLDWDGIAMLTIQSSHTESRDSTDTQLSTRSTQPVQNNVITDALAAVGVVFVDDDKELPYVDEPESFEGVWQAKLTHIAVIKDEEIDSIAEEVLGDG